MLITHLRPSEPWGKKAYDSEGRFPGAGVAIASRRGGVHKVVVKRIQVCRDGRIESGLHATRGIRRCGRSEAVAARAYGDDDLRILGVTLQLRSQPLDEGAEVVALVAVRRSPDSAQQCPVVHHLTGILGQR